MTSLDEKIAALFRKGSPTSADAELVPSVDRTVAEEAASEVVVSEPTKKELKTLTTAPRRLLRALWQSRRVHHGRDWIEIRRSASAGRCAISKPSERN